MLQRLKCQISGIARIKCTKEKSAIDVCLRRHDGINLLTATFELKI